RARGREFLIKKEPPDQWRLPGLSSVTVRGPVCPREDQRPSDHQPFLRGRPSSSSAFASEPVCPASPTRISPVAAAPAIPGSAVRAATSGAASTGDAVTGDAVTEVALAGAAGAGASTCAASAGPASATPA